MREERAIHCRKIKRCEASGEGSVAHNKHIIRKEVQKWQQSI